LTLDWSPLRLLSGQVMVQRIAADRVAAERRPVPSGSSSTVRLPLRIDVTALHIGQVDLAAPVLGQVVDQAAAQPAAPPAGQRASQTISLTVDGAARLDSSDQGAARLELRRLNGEGTYALDAQL